MIIIIACLSVSVVLLVLPEFFLRQVELHVFIFLVLFVQLPQSCVRRLIARLLHERVNILLKGSTEECAKDKSRYNTKFSKTKII